MTTALKGNRFRFAAAAFLSATLLFSMQPMVARMVTPELGGAPAVWNTSLVFFQVMLLAGYAWSHFLARRFSAGAQKWIQVAIIVAASTTLPLGLSERFAVDTQWPISWLLGTLLISVGLPFFALATQAPMLQHWFGLRGLSPYFLYAASNAGSFLGLIAYPVLIEPFFNLRQQSRGWSLGFLLLVLMVTGIGKISPSATPERISVPWRSHLKWFALALIPSSLLQGVTTYLTSDIASIPLLWVIPLALYLATYVAAFSVPSAKLKWVDSTFALAGAALVAMLALNALKPVWLLFLLHLGFFALASLFCHSRLAETKPEPGGATSFYLSIAAGGAAGGILNSLAAPNIFSGVVEYPIMIFAALLTRVAEWKAWWREIAIIFIFGLIACFAAVAGAVAKLQTVVPAIAVGLLTALCCLAFERRLRFAFGLAGVLGGAALIGPLTGLEAHKERNFFGILRVTEDRAAGVYRLYHGTTIHGIQRYSGANRCEPLSYYYSGGAFDQLWRFALREREVANVGAIGLGSGSALAVATPGQRWTVFEIDPDVVRLSRDGPWFTFLKCSPAKIDYVLGDARVRLGETADGSFDLLLLDAFSSDSIPVHLLTREAMALYRRKLKADGWILAHVSSRSLALKPALVCVAQAEGLTAYEPKTVANPNDRTTLEAIWVLLVPAGRKIDSLERVHVPGNAPLWTDDFSSVWRVISL